MGKTLFLDINDLCDVVTHNISQNIINFIIDPRELFTYEQLGLSLEILGPLEHIAQDNIKIFYSIKLESSLRLFLSRMLQYTLDHKEQFESDDIQYIVYLFDVPQLNLDTIREEFMVQIQDTNLTLYFIQES